MALLLLLWAHGIYVAIARARAVWQNRLPQAPGEPYAVLMNTTQNTIPRSLSGFDFVSWYLKSYARPSDVRETDVRVLAGQLFSLPPSVTVNRQHCHTPGTVELNYVCPSLHGPGRYGARSGGTVVGDRDARTVCRLVYVRYLPKRDFARAYVFNNAWFIVRPLWTYVAEEAGSSIDLVFYGVLSNYSIPRTGVFRLARLCRDDMAALLCLGRNPGGIIRALVCRDRRILWVLLVC
jgi:hypothetical protein